jgi:CMP-N,N'-diacetyllegionaminic acid synthase
MARPKKLKPIDLVPAGEADGTSDMIRKTDTPFKANKPVEEIKTIAIIPARAGSKGIVDKNVRHVGGRILIDHSIRSARAAGLDLIISTDSVQYKDKIDAMYPKDNYCPFLRPKELASDGASSASVILHALEYLEGCNRIYDIIVLLEPTNPVREVRDITAPLAYFKRQKKYDSLVSFVVPPEHHPMLAMECKPIDHEEGFFELKPHSAVNRTGEGSIGHPRRQALSDACYMNGNLYISWVDKFKKNKIFDCNPCIGWKNPKWKSVEVDEPDDIIIVEQFIKRVI